jgi:outer membrane receptor protein involved in Fe transport
MRRVAFVLACALVAAASTAQAQDQVETVVVTGSRIPRPAYDMPNPVATVNSEEIAHSGTVNLTDYLKRIPALTGSLGDFATSGYNTPAANDLSSLGGLNLLDLRNLSYVRTLVLVDNHRVVSESTGSAAVDIDTIPISLIDRVDVETGGASAVYGADGVSGVVNFIMKHDFEGIHAKVQLGTSTDGGGSKYTESLAVGRNFDDDKGNIEIAYENSNQDPLFFTQRGFTSVGGFTAFVPNPNNKHGKDPNLPAFIPTNDAEFIFSAPTGAITTDLDKGDNKHLFPNYLGDGDIFDIGTYVGGGVSIGSSGMPFANDLQGDFQPNAERHIAQLEGTYRFSRWFKVVGSFHFAGVDTMSLSYPTFDDSTVLLPDNAFISPAVAGAILANKKQEGILREDYLELRNAEEVKRDTYRATFDFSGDLPSPAFLDKMRYDASVVYGQTDVDDIDLHNRIEDRFFAALDSVIDPATGKPTCRSNLDPSAVPPDLHKVIHGFFAFTDTDNLNPADFPFTFDPGPNSGCVPFDPFDPHANNAASIAWMTTNTHTKGVITQQVATAYVTADVPAFQHWGAAKPLSIVLGGEYRRETSESNPDALEQAGLVWIGGQSPVKGAFDVGEGFAEASLPLLEDKPFAKELSIEGAVRQSQYSTAGADTSWKFGGVWAPFDGLKLRATDAVAVRAPNIGELFAPLEHGFAFVNDPCDSLYNHQGTQFRIPNCEAVFALLGLPYDPNHANLQTDQSTPNIIGGNTHLLPETARTLTAGAVIQPDWIPGFTASIDYYRVNIANAIEAPSAQSVANECVDLSTIANPYCNATQRTVTGNFPGSISLVTAQEINVASFATDGVDIDLTYHLDTKKITAKDWGSFDFHLVGNWLDALSTVPLPGEASVESANTFDGGVFGSPTPRAQANLDIVWTFDPVTVDYNFDWYNGVGAVDRQTVISQPNVYARQYLHLPAHFVQSMQIDYQFKKGWDAYVGADNLFNQKPSIGQNGLPAEPLGRFIYMGVKADLDFADLKF